MTEKPPIATFSIQNERRVRRFDLDEQCVLSPELVFIVKKFDASKSECVRAIWSYIIKNNLQLESDRSFFVPDERLSKIFGSKRKIPVFAISKYISKYMY